MEVVAVAHLSCIKGAGNYSELYLKDGSSKLYGKSLTKLSTSFLPNFVRVRKSYILDMALAIKIKTLPGAIYQLVFSSNDIIPVSREKTKALHQ
ncbi:LytTR family DNA-binding domain-containing protein [Thalassomonas actiniarum]|uniref:LytTR family transcriptional regulator n=1 Tax=Thalassomonas actiniarum TaxID=485447 RepID=A0AAF0C6W1_9GAMM|nr:LytTR family DNA-binding domain-containing protein [Thalassomonas actiniarum]WDE02716.1 LytTR family transcriptional regulator [Thalassomonas actiniarum]